MITLNTTAATTASTDRFYYTQCLYFEKFLQF